MASSVKKNYIYSAGFQLLIIILPLITSPYISRTLGADMLGTQSYYYSIATYFYMFAMLGVSNYGNRSVAQIRENKEKLTQTFWTIYGFQLFRAVIVLAAYYIYVILFQRNFLLIALINGLYVFSAAIEINWLFFGLEKFKITVTRNIIIKVANVILIFLLVKQESDLWIYSLLVCGSAVITNVSLWLFAKRYIGFYKPKLVEFIPHIKPELALFIPVIAISLYNVMDRIMVGSISTKAELGYYYNAESIIAIPLSFITALGNVMMPHASNLIAKGKIEQSKKEIEKSIIFVMILSSAMAFGVASIADVFAPVYWGKNFYPCAILIMGLAAKIIISSWANVVRTQYLIPRNHDREYIISVVAGAIVNLTMNFILIPLYGAFGAVVGTIAAEFTVAFIQTLALKKELPIRKYIVDSIPFLLAGAVMYGCVKFATNHMNTSMITFFVGTFIGALVYGAIILPILIFSKSIAIQGVKQSIFGMLKRK